MLDSRCWILDAGCWMLDSRCRMLDSRYWILNAGCWIWAVISIKYVGISFITPRLRLRTQDTRLNGLTNDICFPEWAGLNASSCCESCCLSELADPNNVALSWENPPLHRWRSAESSGDALIGRVSWTDGKSQVNWQTIPPENGDGHDL